MRFRTSLRDTLIEGAFAVCGLFVFVFMFSTVLRLDPQGRFGAVTISSVGRGVFEALSVSGDSEQAVFWELAGNTVWVAMKGFALGIVVALCVSFLLCQSESLARIGVSALSGFRAVPLTLLIAVLGFLPKWHVLPPWHSADVPGVDPSWLIGVGTFVYVLIGIVEGYLNRSQFREKIVRIVWRWSKLKYLALVAWREALPHFFVATRIGLLFSLVLTVVFEQILLIPGVGNRIYQDFDKAGDVSNPEIRAMAFLVLLGLIGIVLDAIHQGIRWFILRHSRN